MPLISVVIPVYNGEKTIRETIESVINQTFSDFELIVINDGSQDSTLKILATLPDPRLKVYSYPNAGLSASRNRGIALATGEYITFLDADDLWTPDKLAAQLAALTANPDAAVAYSWTDYIDEAGQFISLGGHTLVNGDVFASLLVRNFLECGSNPLIRAKALREAGDFDITLNSAGDWDMWLRLAARYHFVGVPIAQVLYRRTGTSMSGNVLRQEVECLKVLNRAYAQAPELLPLKRRSLANIYTYLTAKSLEGLPTRRQGGLAARFLWRAVINDPAVLGQVKYILTLLFKIATAILLPPHQAQALRKRVKSLVNNGSKRGHHEA